MSATCKIFLKIDVVPKLKVSVERAKSSGYAGIVTTIFKPHLEDESVDEASHRNELRIAHSKLDIHPKTWVNEVIPYLYPPGAIEEETRASRFATELGYAIFLGSSTIVIKLTNHDPAALGLFLKNAISDDFSGRILVELPVGNYQRNSLGLYKHSEGPECDKWKAWNTLHAATGYHSRVQLALRLTPDLLTETSMRRLLEEKLRRWLGENVGLLIVSNKCFQYSNQQIPFLSLKAAEIVKIFVQYTQCSVAVEMKANDSDFDLSTCADSVVACNRSVRWFGHEDAPRFPLQPLYDDLDNFTYETFEKDPSKYVFYQRAIEAAMVDKSLEGGRLVLMLVGAGRGSLVRAALNACKKTNRKLKILVVEKNPNAIVTLSAVMDIMWKDEDVTLIAKDMRSLELDEKVDILVSELLGSFGDNELSPECLDGAQRLLKPDGISIPCKSVSHLRPVMSSKAYASLGLEYPDGKFCLDATQACWVVLPSSFYYIDGPKELFTFVHPNHDQPVDNSRHKNLEFEAKQDCMLHGFTGYFTAQLYKHIEISIHPNSHTQGMFSWYPMFFPIQQPTYVKSGETISAEFWRKVKPGDKVWYEWRAQSDKVSNIDGEICPFKL